MAASHHGGYHCDFVDPIPESLTCPVCLLPFRDPHLLDCCGAKYCAECIGRVKKSGRPCPICRKRRFNTLIDKNEQRKVLNLKVRCSRRNKGCRWTGELRRLKHHKKEECEWSRVECYKCGKLVSRCRLTEHELDQCLLRPIYPSIVSNRRDVELAGILFMELERLERARWRAAKIAQMNQSMFEMKIKLRDNKIRLMSMLAAPSLGSEIH